MKGEEYYLLVDGETEGPVSKDVLATRLRVKVLDGEALCARAGEEWRPVREVVPEPVARKKSAVPGLLVIGAAVALLCLMLGIAGMASSEAHTMERQAKKYLKDQVGFTKLRGFEEVRPGVFRAEVDFVNAMGGPARKRVLLEVDGEKVKETAEAPEVPSKYE